MFAHGFWSLPALCFCCSVDIQALEKQVLYMELLNKNLKFWPVPFFTKKKKLSQQLGWVRLSVKWATLSLLIQWHLK